MNNNPKFCDSKICPEGVARPRSIFQIDRDLVLRNSGNSSGQNPTRILSACPEKCLRHFRDLILATFQVAQDKVIPDFSPPNFVRPQNLGYPAKQDKLDENLSLRPFAIAQGGFFYRKIRDRRLRLSLFSFILIVVLACGTGYAGEDQTRPAQTPTEGQESVAGRGKVSPEALRRWQQLSPEQKQKLRGRLEQWKNLDPERKAEIKQRFQQYQQLSPELKEKVRRNWKKIKNLPPERRREMAAKYKQWKQLPPDEKRQIRERFHRLKELSPEQRQRLRERREKWQGLAPERKQELREEFRQRVNDRRGGGGRSLEDRPAEARRPFEGDRPRPAAGGGEISDMRQKSGGPGPEPAHRERGGR